MTTREDETVGSMSVLRLIELIAELTNDQGIEVNGPAYKYLRELGKRLDLTEMQAMLLSVFVDQCDDSRINFKDIARHFDVRPVKIISLTGEINELVKIGAIVARKDSDGDVTYRVPRKVLDSLREGSLPKPEKLENLTIHEFIDMVDKFLKLRENEEIEDEDLYHQFTELIENNQNLLFAQKLKSFGFRGEDLVLYLAMCSLFINNHDDRICRSDIRDYFSRSDLRTHTNELEAGNHTLMSAKLIEHSCDDGQVDSEHWCLTNYSKEEVLSELNLKVQREVRSNLTHYEDIAEKKLFFNDRVSKQVNELQNLLEGERMTRVMQRLKNKGMRRGFTCLFYGSPGTGKTETVLQLAKKTGRDIMLVDVPSIRSKWVGETEKNVKQVFERYAKIAKNNKMMPILLFNEADALLNRRCEGATDSVDKMENAMQNIILQEMENLEGIMIATTNLTGSLDAAFERRFLYKIEFDKPTANESKHIWKSLIPELKDEDAHRLAAKYSFSGGQIENIARKQIINDILSDSDELNVQSIEEACENEQISKSKTKRIGF